jgi:hypothetical protein
MTPSKSARLQNGIFGFVKTHRGFAQGTVLCVAVFDPSFCGVLSVIIDWFDVLDGDNKPLLTEREVLRNLQAVITDADKTPVLEVARNSIGVLSTENRKIWSSYRDQLSSSKHNSPCLDIVDGALFIVCLDDSTPDNLAELSSNFLCGTYNLVNGVQIGTCTNRWYDKVWVFSEAFRWFADNPEAPDHRLRKRICRYQFRAHRR